MMDALHLHDSRVERDDDASVSMGLLPALLVGIVLFAIATIAHAELYKWTDSRGVVHYSDHLPPDAVNGAHEELNHQGVAIRHTGKAAPLSQQATSTAEEERNRQLARDRQASERRDRALLDSYSSVAEIELAKGRALSTIRGQIASTTSYAADIARRCDELKAEKAAYGSRPVPAAITHELASTEAELARQQAFIAERKNEAATITARYDADRLRYEQLTRSPSSSATSIASSTQLSSASRLSAASQASAARN